jgi:hypothetical protein
VCQVSKRGRPGSDHWICKHPVRNCVTGGKSSPVKIECARPESGVASESQRAAEYAQEIRDNVDELYGKENTPFNQESFSRRNSDIWTPDLEDMFLWPR